MERVLIQTEIRISAIGCQRVLSQIVRADAKKIDVLREEFRLQRSRWNLDHDTGLDRPAMRNMPRFQVRIFLKKEFAEAVMRDETPAEMQPLLDILAKYNAVIDHNQLKEFTEFVADAEAGRKTKIPADQVAGVLALTKNSLANPEKRSYFAREFTLSVGGKDLLQGTAAEALIADLKTLGDGPILTHGKAFVHGGSRDVETVRKSYLPKVHPL